MNFLKKKKIRCSCVPHKKCVQLPKIRNEVFRRWAQYFCFEKSGCNIQIWKQRSRSPAVRWYYLFAVRSIDTLSVIIRMPSENPYRKADSSARECSSLTASSYLASDSFCCSVSVLLSLSRFLPIRESRCLNCRFWIKKDSCGSILPYHRSSSVVIRISPRSARSR